MDAIAITDAQDPNFWQGTPSSDHEWHIRRHNNSGSDVEEEEDEEDPIQSWDLHGSLTGEDDAAYPDFNSYGYGDHLGYNAGDWSSDTQDPENRTPGAAPLQRRSQKRKSENDGFDPTSSPSRSMAGSPINSSGSKGGRNGGGGGSGSGTGSLFFKTKLCIKFRAGTCPYNSNCNFAHGMEELRKPPPGWEELVGAQDGGNGSSGGGTGSTGRNNIKENAAGQLVLSSSDSQRFRRTRRCKKFYSEEGCPYGDRCNFLHDDQAKARESNAISLGPSTSSSGGSGGGNAGGSGNAERPSNWKTRMCNKWEMTGHCPFGQKCNFAHGLAELQTYAGSTVDSESAATTSNGLPSDGKQANKSTAKPDVSTPTAYGSDVHNTLRHRGAFPSSSKTQKQVKLLENWKGPGDVISTIYGDWIEEDE